MYQNFNVSKRVSHKKRLQKLRTLISEEKLQGFLIPRADLHQNEYIEACDSRLEWITGFTGSAGLCLVKLKSAFIFVDGRYEVQAQKETNKNLFNIIKSSCLPFNIWLRANSIDEIIGYDPWLHTVSEVKNLTNDNNKINLRKCSNLVDAIWNDRPRRKLQSIETHPQKFSGISSRTKRTMIAQSIENNGAEVVVLTKPESICWLLNIRGKDISHTPIVQCYAIVTRRSTVKVFFREETLSRKIMRFLGTDVEVLNISTFSVFISSLKEENIQIDPASCPIAIFDLLKSHNKNILEHIDPCILPKAKKNSIEISGAKKAHLIDGAAFIRFLHWLDSFKNPKDLDEITITKTLEAYRNETGLLEEIAFDTICGSGSNAAIVHYKVTAETNKKLENNPLLLIDSGGQYRMGTTDLTRTVAIGKPEQKMIDIFTKILKGMIQVSILKWPVGLSGQHMDILARAPLWEIGLDYDHGTGHGVGSYLSVHEGPHGISRNNNIPLVPGMIISNEPGYYEPGKFGIRIENILLVKDLKKEKKTSKQMLAFETLTLAPIDRRMIDVRLLTKTERDWLNNYHNLVYEKIQPLLSKKVGKWLKKICSPI